MLGTRITRRQRCSVNIAHATQNITAACSSGLSQLYIQLTVSRFYLATPYIAYEGPPSMRATALLLVLDGDVLAGGL